MTNFDEISSELGWEKINKDVPLFYKYGEDFSTVSFSLAGVYESYNKEEILTKEQVSRAIGTFSHTKFKDDKKNWIIPMLTSDYFVHKIDFDSAAKWAKIAMKENPNLTKDAFINKVKERI